VSSQQQNSFSKQIGHWLTKIGSKDYGLIRVAKGVKNMAKATGATSTLFGGLAAGAGAAVTSTEVATAVGFVAASAATGGTFAIVAAGLIGVGLLTMGVSMGLRAISTAKSEYKGFSGDQIKQSQHRILTAFEQKINDSKPATDSSSNNSDIKRTLNNLTAAIRDLGDLKSIQTKGRRAMGYPRTELSKVIAALPTDQMDDVCTLLAEDLKLNGDFYTIGISLDYNHKERIPTGGKYDYPEQRSSKFELRTTEYSKIEQNV